MPSQQNVEKVKEIKARLEDVEAAYFADYRGLTVPDIAEVRSALRAAEAQLAVVKNTLTRLAVRDMDLEALEEFLEGPTAVAFVKGDIVTGAKALVDAAKRFPVLEVKGGVAEGRVLTGEEIRQLASLDTREEMLATVAGLLSLHMRKAASLFQALQVKFLMLMKAHEEKLAGEAPAEEQPEPEVPTEEPEPEVPTEQPEPEVPTEEPEREGGEEPGAPAEPATAEESTEDEQEQEDG